MKPWLTAVFLALALAACGGDDPDEGRPAVEIPEQLEAVSTVTEDGVLVIDRGNRYLVYPWEASQSVFAATVAEMAGFEVAVPAALPAGLELEGVLVFADAPRPMAVTVTYARPAQPPFAEGPGSVEVRALVDHHPGSLASPPQSEEIDLGVEHVRAWVTIEMEPPEPHEGAAGVTLVLGERSLRANILMFEPEALDRDEVIALARALAEAAAD